MTVSTLHIRAMLAEAIRLANAVDDHPANVLVHRPEPGWPEKGATGVQALERAANLARHAAAELEDELLRARNGWPVV